MIGSGLSLTPLMLGPVLSGVGVTVGVSVGGRAAVRVGVAVAVGVEVGVSVGVGVGVREAPGTGVSVGGAAVGSGAAVAGVTRFKAGMVAIPVLSGWIEALKRPRAALVTT